MKPKYLLSILFILEFNHIYSQRNFDIGDALISSTIQISSIKKEVIAGKEKYVRSTGTGFFFQYKIDDKRPIPVIITNKHVIKNSIQGTLYFKLSDSTGNPIYGKTEKVLIRNFAQQCILHPDTSVDLAIFPIAPIINNYFEKRIRLFYSPLEESLIPNDSLINNFNAIEDIFMIGYPYGLRDSVNDLPIVRKGITATPLYLDYNKKKEFLIDMPVFFGSSGSPIFIYNHGAWFDGSGVNLSQDGRILLLGINYATYSKEFDGKLLPIISENIEDTLKTSTPLPLYNIGVIIKAEKILDFKPLLISMIRNKSK